MRDLPYFGNNEQVHYHFLSFWYDTLTKRERLKPWRMLCPALRVGLYVECELCSAECLSSRSSHITVVSYFCFDDNVITRLQLEPSTSLSNPIRPHLCYK